MISKSLLSVAMMALFLSACSDSKDSAPAIPTVPENLGFQKPVPGKKLTREQLLEVQSMFADKPMMKLPPGELIFDREMDSYEKYQQEQSLRYSDPMSYSMLKDIQDNCAVQDPQESFNTSLPQNPDGSLNGDNLKAGDFVNINVVAGIKSGNRNCPANLSLSAGANAKLHKFDAQKQEMTVSAEAGFKGNGQILKPAYSNLLKSKGLIVDTNMSGVTAVMENKSDVVVRFRLAGSYHSLQTTIPYDSNVAFLVKGATLSQEEDYDAPETGTVEWLMKTVIKFPKFEVNVEVHAQGKNGAGEMDKMEFYVNGHFMTQEEMERLFGQDNNALGLDSKIKNLIKL